MARYSKDDERRSPREEEEDEDRLRLLIREQNETIVRLERQHQRQLFLDEREWSPVKLTKDDWMVYLRIQKTGSQTLWLTLIEAIDGRVWTNKKCARGPFCGYRCSRVLAAAFESFKNDKCHLFVRAHANFYDYVTAADLVGVERRRLHFLAFLREPLARARSEHEHVTRGLVAQFGPQAFGKAWDYNFTDRRKASLGDWLKCDSCRVGSSNRQTRFLAGSATTGSPRQGEDLDAALRNLKRCTFVGILDRFSDSMLLLKETFPTHLARFTSYSLSLHPKLAPNNKLRLSDDNDDETQRILRDLNRLDSALYEKATELFEERWTAMLASLPQDRRSMRFKAGTAARRSNTRRFVLSH